MPGKPDFRRVQGATAYIHYFITKDFIDFRIIPQGVYGIVTHTKPVSIDMSFKEFADIVFREFGIVLEEETLPQEEQEEEQTGGGGNPVGSNYIIGFVVNNYRDLIVRKEILEEKRVTVERTDSGISTSTGEEETEVPDIGVVVIYEVGIKKIPDVSVSQRTWVERRDDIEAGAVLTFSEESVTMGGFLKRREVTGTYSGEVYSHTIEYTSGGIPDGLSGSLEYEARQLLHDACGIFMWYPGRSIYRIVVSEEYSNFQDGHGNPHKLLTSRSFTATLTILDDELLVNDEYSVTRTKILYDWEQHDYSVTPKYIEYISQRNEFHWNTSRWESEGGSIHAIGKGVYESYRYDNVGYPDEPVITLVETQRQMVDSKPSPNFPIAELIFSRRLVYYGNPENAYEYNTTFIENHSDALACAKRIYEQLLYDYVSDHGDNSVATSGDSDYGGSTVIPGYTETTTTYTIRRSTVELCSLVPLGNKNITYVASASTRRTIVECEERVT
jgi:hypothetical protein